MLVDGTQLLATISPFATTHVTAREGQVAFTRCVRQDLYMDVSHSYIALQYKLSPREDSVKIVKQGAMGAGTDFLLETNTAHH